MDSKITQALHRLFEKHRIVFWYDSKKELRSDFEGLQINGIQKVEINNNEFGLKYRILREEPTTKFLLYKEDKQPDDLKNWLLDVQLSHGVFSTDQAAIWLADLELGIEFLSLIENHMDFFKATERRTKFQKLLVSEDTRTSLQLKMLAVCCRTEPHLENILEQLLHDRACSKDEKEKLIIRCNLKEFFWKQISTKYSYHTESPSLEDFFFELFKSCYAMKVDGDIRLSNDALVFIKRWKDSRTFATDFENLSHEVATVLKIEENIQDIDFKDLLDVDLYKVIDQKIIHSLVNIVKQKTASHDEVGQWVRQRKDSHWYNGFKHLYLAIDYASELFAALDDIQLGISSLEDGIQKYQLSWFKIDQLYRKFVFHYRKSNQHSLLTDLFNDLDQKYCNLYLLPISNDFQNQVDGLAKWSTIQFKHQKKFFSTFVEPVLNANKKICVIISDALRYEVGEELHRKIQQEDRFRSELQPMMSMLPSSTQFGMAALLPNKKLTFPESKNGAVLVDGLNSVGLDSRRAILQNALPDKNAYACKAQDILGYKTHDLRELLTQNDVFYIYHDLIDNTGDNRTAEERVFEAADSTIDEIITLVKKLTSANANNVIVTADHGFQYQHNPIDKSDFSTLSPEGTRITYQNRRYIVGEGLQKQQGLFTFTPEQLQLDSHLEFQFSKSLHRLRQKGSGSRFVHGGATLQEIVIPLLQINKRRESDISKVDVEILRGANTLITTNQHSVTFYQHDPVTEKLQPRILRASLYTTTGTRISDVHTITFDSDSENTRDREQKFTFVLSKDADQANNKEVLLKLEEQHKDTTHFIEYKSVRYIVRRSFSTDFDF